MGIEARTVQCDLCGGHAMEPEVNAGWQGWAIIQGIGAQAPVEGQPIKQINLETYVCPGCKHDVSKFLTRIQAERRL